MNSCDLDVARRLFVAWSFGLALTGVIGLDGAHAQAATSESMLSAVEEKMTQTHYKTVEVDGVKLFYREAGPMDASAVLLMHGFPTSSHMFRRLIPALADRYHVVAPDYPGFGNSDFPDPKAFRYSFESYARIMDKFTQAIGLERYALYIQDYGSPVGLRLALIAPERVTALIVQNGNAYEEPTARGCAAG